MKRIWGSKVRYSCIDCICLSLLCCLLYLTAAVLQAYNDLQCIPFEKRTLPVFVEVVFITDIFLSRLFFFSMLLVLLLLLLSLCLMHIGIWYSIKRQSIYFKINFLFMLGKFNMAEHTINTDIFKAAIAASA